MNAIQVIQPYRHSGTWVFDDEDKGLDKEPFVAGIPEMIDAVVKPEVNQVRMLFSKYAIPNADIRLRWISEDVGNWYEDEAGNRGWLCPALLKYFDKAPKDIYVKVEEL